MAKPEWGLKRFCPSCSAAFYDLNKVPIVCPKCAATFEPEQLTRLKRSRSLPPKPKPVVEKKKDDGDGDGEDIEDLIVDVEDDDDDDDEDDELKSFVVPAPEKKEEN